jgi:4-amino-4-deoxy-L-arabinose transferase-like glycosyltransferase
MIGSSACPMNIKSVVGGLNRWRLALLVFVVVYAVFLLLDLGYMTIQWDEMPHLYGSLVLFRGDFQGYVAAYGYYPPLYDIITTGFFKLLGASAFSGRVTAVTFSLLSIWAVFEFANRTYGPKTALIAAVVLGVTPGFFWLSRAAMLETALIFFFSLALYFFFLWLRLGVNKTLILCGLAIGVGFLAKYQILVAGLVMLTALLILSRDKLKAKSSKFLWLPIIAVLVIVPWILVLYQINGLDKLGALLYVIQEGGQDRAIYSTRFAMPIFYLVEMTWPYADVHPVSLPLYILGLTGLGLWAYRRKTEDKFFLIWFFVVYVFFTLIPNKQWRYVTPLFPVLAISAASLLAFSYDKVIVAWKVKQLHVNKTYLKRIAALSIGIIALTALAYSSVEAYQMVARDQIHLPTEEAVNYVGSQMNENESILVVCAFNFFNKDMVKFYLHTNETTQNQVLQYPEMPVDAFTPDFNLTVLVTLCEEQKVKYAFLPEYGGDVPYFGTNMTAMTIYQELTDSGRFTFEHRVGDFPRTITIFSFT